MPKTRRVGKRKDGPKSVACLYCGADVGRMCYRIEAPFKLVPFHQKRINTHKWKLWQEQREQAMKGGNSDAE